MDPVVDSAYGSDLNQKPEGKTYDFLPVSHIKIETLQTFNFPSLEQIINIETKEFSSVCPFSGLPDICTVKIKYKPIAGIAIELKSLKYYFVSFRQVGIAQEFVTAKIYNDLKTVLKTDKLYVSTLYNTRGGIDVLCEQGDKNF